MNRKNILSGLLLLWCTSLPSVAQKPAWPEPKQEAKPYTRWWWLGSAVDKEGLKYNLSEYQKAGIGGVEITPIYGVQGNEANDIPYLTPRWMQMLKETESLGKQLGIEVDMATGTGWPFGGPGVPTDEAACRLRKDATDFTIDRTRQKVKRAAPGGEGWVIDHFNKEAVRHYLDTFDRAFSETSTPRPACFFNDSYEVYQADWTPTLLKEFQARRGYSLEDHKTAFFDETHADHKLIISDYRETLGELLLENFTEQWTNWAHTHGAITRNQAHGSPANLIDIYSAVDIPECEGFGLSDFGIHGLRRDIGYTKKNDSDISMLKYASSAAHISGKRLTSSETFTWLTEHFRTSLSQCKPDFDLMMVAGVNHVFFHGSCYSPKAAEWPGWRFYASVDMSPNNNWWSAMPAFSKYIERVQSFMQFGQPDNDLLVYLPYYDMIYEQPGRLLQFDIHSMAKKAPKFIDAINKIITEGYDCDYISDKYIQQLTCKNGKLSIAGSAYGAIVIPDVRFMPLETIQKLVTLAESGARIIVKGQMPQSVPGLGRKEQQADFSAAVRRLSELKTQEAGCQPEPMRSEQGLSLIRRVDVNGHYYFISNLQEKDIDGWVTLGRPAKSAIYFNPMNGDIDEGWLTHDDSGNPKLYLQLRSGESAILYTSIEGSNVDGIAPHRYLTEIPEKSINLEAWTLTFPKAEPEAVTEEFRLKELKSWTELENKTLRETMATGRYTTTFNISAGEMPDETMAYILDLGDVRETAHVWINGIDAATLFAVPYRIDVSNLLKEGTNEITIDVCNLPANRIAKLDRDGAKWRRFREINVVDLNYKTDTYASWTPVPSGLCSQVRLIPCAITSPTPRHP